MKLIILFIANFLCISLFSQDPETDCSKSTNLVLNPHFDAGNTDFTSTLIYGSNCYTGYYYVGPSMQSKCSIWPSSFVDHTSGTGNFMLVDGHASIAPQDVWAQNVQVLANVAYTFSFWAKNLYSQSPFSLGFAVNGQQIDTTEYIAYGTWTKYSTVWIAPSTSTISIAIRQMTPDHYRDFGIDDIFMGYCKNTITGMPSDPNEDGLMIYPNPSTGVFQLSGVTQQGSFFSVYDLIGNCILNKISLQNSTHSIDLNHLPKGIYFVEIISDQHKSVKKISLQ